MKHIIRCLNNQKRLYTCIIAVFTLWLVLTIAFCRIRKEPDKVWDLRGKITTLTENLIGLPYRFGGYELDGFDCSGLVYYVYDCFGIKLPRTAKKQAKLKRKISLNRAKPGDILAFKLKGGWHTAIYFGGEWFIHAPNKRGAIRKEKLDSFWKKRLKKVIRIIKD